MDQIAYSVLASVIAMLIGILLGKLGANNDIKELTGKLDDVIASIAEATTSITSVLVKSEYMEKELVKNEKEHDEVFERLRNVENLATENKTMLTSLGA